MIGLGEPSAEQTADAEREAEFWRTRQRESAGPDESDLCGSETRPN